MSASRASAGTGGDLPPAEPGAKMMFLIRRRPDASREELILHWFANHMPGVIAAQSRAKASGRAYARRYRATLFDDPIDAAAEGAPVWDGVAQLWFDKPLPRPRAPFGDPPRDSFQEKARPYWPWATVEYVIVDGSDRLPVAPLTLNAPFPTTRSGFFKVTHLVAALPGADVIELARHWLTVHAPKVRAALLEAGGFRYVISMSLDPTRESYAGMAELYFPDATAWRDYRQLVGDHGMGRWVDEANSQTQTAGTEMIGIP